MLWKSAVISYQSTLLHYFAYADTRQIAYFSRKLELVMKKLGHIGGLATDISKPFLQKCAQFLNAPENKVLVQEYIMTVNEAVQDYQV